MTTESRRLTVISSPGTLAREILGRVGRLQNTHVSPGHPLSFEEEAARAGVSTQVAVGVQPVRVRRIVGSAGKARTLGSDFLPLGRGPAAAHFKDIFRLMKQGEQLPAITLYQLGYRYFVLDGHTRVAAARKLDIEFLDANVIEALPRKAGSVYHTYRARREFEQATGLQSIRLTAPWRYDLLQQHLEGYRHYLERSWQREIPLPEAARIWHRTQYEPTLLEINRRHLPSATGGCTAGDVYTDILKAWANAETPRASLREALERYDHVRSQSLGPLMRARRLISNLVYMSLPGLATTVIRHRAATFDALDVQADLDCTNNFHHQDS